MSESFKVGALLALAGGFLDAYTYLLRGNVFANAQTGNIVLLGLSLAELDGIKALFYLTPIFTYACGICAAEVLKRGFQTHPYIHWRQLVVFAEMLIVAAVAFVPQPEADPAVNAAISFVCAMQTQSFIKLKGSAYATTMCTGNLRNASANLFRFMIQRDGESLSKAIQYFGIIGYFILGAVLSFIAGKIFLERAALFCLIPLFAGVCLMFCREQEK